MASNRRIPRVGEQVSIADRPGWTGQVREVIRKDDRVYIRLMPQPPADTRTLHPVTEDVVALEALEPHQ